MYHKILAATRRSLLERAVYTDGHTPRRSMHHFLSFCGTYAGAIQAFATIVLIGITAYYARLTSQSLNVARDQLRVASFPQVSIGHESPQFGVRAPGTAYFTIGLSITNEGIYPFTIITAQARTHNSWDSVVPVDKIPLPELRDRVIVSHGEVRKEIKFDLPTLQPNVVPPWKLELALSVHDALRSTRYHYLYDNVNGLRQVSTKQFTASSNAGSWTSRLPRFWHWNRRD